MPGPVVVLRNPLCYSFSILSILSHPARRCESAAPPETGGGNGAQAG